MYLISRPIQATLTITDYSWVLICLLNAIYTTEYSYEVSEVHPSHFMQCC